MECPTKEKILEAAEAGDEVKRALMSLFPGAFSRKIKKGELYEWGTDSNGGSGLVIESYNSKYLSFVNFRTGDVYAEFLSKSTTVDGLNNILGRLQSKDLHNCYHGVIRGPHYFKSWSTKDES